MDLAYDVLVVDGLPLQGRPTPDGQPLKWSPTSVTLITSGGQSVLVDGLLTRADGDRLAEWIDAHHTRLDAIYITHGHGDHFFGLGPVLERYPHARVLARPEVIAEMAGQITGPMFGQVWQPLFGDKLTETFVSAELAGDSYELNGHAVEFVHAGHSDTVHTTFVHVPDLGLVVAGDIVYNNVYPYVVYTSPDKRSRWRACLDLVAARSPAHVVAGHKDPASADDPRHIELTRQFLFDVDEVLERGEASIANYEEMVRRHPDRINRGALWGGIAAQTKLRDSLAQRR